MSDCGCGGGCRSRCENGCRCRGDRCRDGGLIEKAGSLITDSESFASPVVAYLGDLNTDTVPISYPVANRTRFVNIAAHLRIDSTFPDGTTALVEVLRNGGVVSTFSLLFTAASPATLRATAQQVYAPSDLYDVRVTLTPPQGNQSVIAITVSATIGTRAA